MRLTPGPGSPSPGSPGPDSPSPDSPSPGSPDAGSVGAGGPAPWPPAFGQPAAPAPAPVSRGAGRAVGAVAQSRVFPPRQDGDSQDGESAAEEGDGTAREAAPAHAVATAYSLGAGRGGAQGHRPDGVAGDDDGSYLAGYSYGPGYGDVCDSGYGHGTAVPPAGQEAAPVPGPAGTFGGSAAGPPRVPQVVGPTPALRGLPGGPGIELIGDETGQAGPAARRQQSTGSVWQRAQSRWSDSGIVWQRPVAHRERAETEWERLRSATKPAGRRRGRKGLAEPRPHSRGPRAAHGRPRGSVGRTIVVGVAVLVALAVIAAAYLISG